MKLASPSLERRLRKQARRELRADRTLWNDYRRHRTWWLRRKLRDNGQGVLLVAYILFVVQFAVRQAEFALIAIAIYASATTLFRSFSFRTQVVFGLNRAVLLNLPISDEAFFAHEWRSFEWSWARAFFFFSMAYGAMVVGRGWNTQQLGLALAAAGLQTICGLAVGCWLAALMQHSKPASISMPMYALIIVCLWLSPAALHYVWRAVLVMPGGWVSHGFAGLIGFAHSRESYWLVPAIAIASSLPFAYRPLRRRMLAELTSQTSTDSAEFGAQLSGQPKEREEFGGELAGLNPELSQQHFLQGADWDHAGWLERFAGRWLTAREKAVADFLLADHLGGWSQRWRTAAFVSGLGIILTVALPPLPSWIFFLPVVFAAMWGAPLFGGFWVGFNGAPNSGQLTPAYAAFPIGYEEVARVMFKCNLIRIAAWAPLVIAYATVLATRLRASAGYGCTTGIEIVLVVLASQPSMVAGHFSMGSDDTKEIRWRTLCYFVLAAILFAIFVVAGFVLFAAETPYIKVLAIVISFVVNVLAWFGYRWLFNSSATDLLSQPQRSL